CSGPAGGERCPPGRGRPPGVDGPGPGPGQSALSVVRIPGGATWGEEPGMLDYGEGPSPPRVGPFVLTFVFALAALLLARESCSEPRLGPPAGKPRPRDAARGPEPSFGSGDETSPGRAGEAPEVRRVGDVEARVAGAAWRV